jgi:predicted metal-dependent phosphoesterase TrpH/glycosyltransferase involved in cell wall biosynthesis
MSHSIGLLTPYSWTAPSEVNDQVTALAVRLAARGHRVTVIAPSADKAAVREARAKVQAVLLGERETVFAADEPSPRHFFAGRTYVAARRPRPVLSAPVDLIANIDVLLEADDLDVLHLYEPFAPALGWASLRHAACPLVATFFGDEERLVQDLMPRLRQQRLFDALDVAVASSATVRDAAARVFPGAYRIIPPGVDLGRFRPEATRRPGPARVVFAAAQGRRQGLGVLLRALRRLDDIAGELEVHVCGHDAQEGRFGYRVPAAFAGRVTFHGRVAPQAMPRLLRDADVLCAPSLGPESAGVVLVEAMAAGAALLVSDVPGHRELVADGREGLIVPSRDARSLAAALRTLVREPAMRQRLAAAGARIAARHDWERIADAHEELYEEIVRRRRHPAARRRRQQRELFADFHVHSHHSKDCVSAAADILERARDVGLDVVAITDHDSVAGGLEARGLAERYGVRVIVGEEVKTAEGEVVGLFLERTIPPGMTFAETIAAIKDQGGIVYVPHPFDRLHTVPSAGVLRANVTEIDVLEVFNARLAFPAFNEQAERFARRYRIPAAAGSDAHVLASLGTALTGMDDFTGAEDFVEALAESRIVRRPKSYLYLQSLKLVQTSLDGQGGKGGKDAGA